MVSIKLLVCTALQVAAVSAVPARDRYMWIPDSEGKLHMVDLLKAEDEDAPVPYFDGEKDVTLNLYTLLNPTVPQRIVLGDSGSYPNFNPKNPTRFVTHGWTGSEKALNIIRDAYLESGLDYNVVIVDWKGPAATEYSIAKRNSRRVGEYLAEVITHLKETKGLNLDDVHIIGHSLGGQLAGVTGNRLNGELARIVGLDAAAPLFGTTSLKNHLDETDAKIVQGLHTNGGLLGWKEPLGHVDFFPNGGSCQPGCYFEYSPCNHFRARAFYAESIRDRKFVATLCDTYEDYEKGLCAGNAHDVMGEWTSPESTGTYFLNTNSEPPYAQGDTGLYDQLMFNHTKTINRAFLCLYKNIIK